MFLSYAAIREKWAYLDCYLSPGPIQFKGEYSKGINYLVKPPNREELIAITESHEKFEMERIQGGKLSSLRDITSMSALSFERIQSSPEIPDTLESGDFVLVGIKQYKPYSQLVKTKINEQFSLLNKEAKA